MRKGRGAEEVVTQERKERGNRVCGEQRSEDGRCEDREWR